MKDWLDSPSQIKVKYPDLEFTLLPDNGKETSHMNGRYVKYAKGHIHHGKGWQFGWGLLALASTLPSILLLPLLSKSYRKFVATFWKETTSGDENLTLYTKKIQLILSPGCDANEENKTSQQQPIKEPIKTQSIQEPKIEDKVLTNVKNKLEKFYSKSQDQITTINSEYAELKNKMAPATRETLEKDIERIQKEKQGILDSMKLDEKDAKIEKLKKVNALESEKHSKMADLSKFKLIESKIDRVKTIFYNDVFEIVLGLNREKIKKVLDNKYLDFSPELKEWCEFTGVLS